MRINHIGIVSIPVADQARALAFYRDTLGFEVLRDSPMGPDQRWIMMAPPGAQTAITLVTWFASMPPGSVQGLLLNTLDIDHDHAELRANGVDISPIAEEHWGRYAMFKDPDGNGFVLRGSLT